MSEKLLKRLPNIALVLLLVTMTGCLPSCNSDEPDPLKIVIVVPEDPQFSNFLPWQARGNLEREVIQNIYDGLFNPTPPSGYSDGIATDLVPVQTSSGPSNTQFEVQLQKKRNWIHPREGLVGPVDAQDVQEAWEHIARSPDYPERSRYTSVIQSIRASSADTLLVTFRMPIDWSKRGREALSFRLFPIPLAASVPVGSGPFVMYHPDDAPRRELRLLPSVENFPIREQRPVVEIRSIPSTRSRLDEVLENRAQVAMGIPPYYLTELRNKDYKPSDPYNVWALAFSPALTQPQRRHLAAELNATDLLEAFLQGSRPSSWGTNIGLEDLLSPTVFPATFEVFECLVNQKEEGRLVKGYDLAERLLDRPQEFEQKPSDIVGEFPKPLRIGYLDTGAYAEGVEELAKNLRGQLDDTWGISDHEVLGLDEGAWLDALRGLPEETSPYHAVLVRFEYGRRCDISSHFEDQANPGPQGGLFHWTGLGWNSGELQELRDLGHCDSAVEPTLRLIRKLHVIAPAKFLFSVPNFIVYDPRLDMAVHDEYVLGGLENWHWGQ